MANRQSTLKPHLSMSLRRKDKLRRWAVRIALLSILLPLATLATVRYAGLFKMRKSDREIKSYILPYKVNMLIDTLSVYGRDIVYLKTGNGEPKNEAMIFVHGSPGSVDAFLEYMVDTALLSKVDLITFDRPGYGNSGFGTSEPYLSRQGDILFDLMQQLGYTDYWLAGHSYGAAVVLQTAIRHPKRVNGVALIAGSISPDEEPESEPWRKWIDVPLFRELLPVSLKVSNEEQIPLRHGLLMLEDDWDRLTMPVAVLHGNKDIIVPYANMAFAREKLTKSDTTFFRTFEGENHFIPWTKKNEVILELVKMIDYSMAK